MTDAPTASATGTPPSPSMDISLPKTDWKMRRIFCWTLGVVILGLLGWAIDAHQPAFAWPLVALLALDVMFYVGGATTQEIVELVQSAGILKAAQAAAGTVTAAATAATDIVHQVGGRNDLAS